MGIFTYTVVFEGFKVPEGVTIPKEIPKSSIPSSSVGSFVMLRASFRQLDSIDSIIDNGDRAQGFVALEDLVRFNYIAEGHFDVCADARKDYDSHLALVKKVSESVETSKYIAEGCWSTLEGYSRSPFSFVMPIKNRVHD
jgi:hypothetical protein